MVVPYSMDPIEKYLSDLDTQISEVLKNEKLSDDEKIKMYNQILQKYISKNEKVEMSIREHQSKDETEAKKKDDNFRSLIKQEISDNNIKKN